MMLKPFGRILFPALLVLIWTAGYEVKAQQPAAEVQQVKESSLSSFEKGDYRSALSGFRTLHTLDASDPLYSYYTGRCLVELNEDLDQAIELLYGASRYGGPEDAMFYLGRAYQLSYNFADARRCFEKYDVTAGRQEKKALNVKHLIGTCRSAGEITSSYNPFEVLNVTYMNLSDSMQFSQVKMKGGDLGRKPGIYFQMDEDPYGLTSLMFKPKDMVKGDYLFYSGYERNGKDGAQIFRVRKGSGKSWSDPEEVSSLNSPGNELLPYYDPIEHDLYFATDGRLGVGGFDLYKSHYDTEHDRWTEPMNLGFPVNSVMDEFLLLPGSDLGLVLFFSNRQGTDSTVTVYRVHLVEPKVKTPYNDHQKLREIAQLGGVAAEMLADLQVADSKKNVEHIQSGQPEGHAVTPVSARIVETPKTAYNITLSEALRHQVVSDSLKDLATNARKMIRESDDPNDRWVWQKQIVVWEKRARDEEALADQLYVKMEQERSAGEAVPAVNPPETIEVHKVIGDLTVYRFRDPDQVYEDQSLPASAGATAIAGSPATNRFEILEQSPYSADNPIPMDEALPRGTFYRIQLGAFGMELEPDAFGGLTPITGEHIAEKGLVKYYAGKFSRYEDASTAIPRIHSLGYEDAFIVAWYNGNPVPTQKAKQLE